jgi:PAS domain-containing protein
MLIREVLLALKEMVEQENNPKLFTEAAEILNHLAKRQSKLAPITHALEMIQEEVDAQNDELLTSRSRLESALNSQANTFEYAPVAYAVLDTAGQIVEANAALRTLFAIRQAKLVGSYFRHHFETSYFLPIMTHLQTVSRGSEVLRLRATLKGGTEVTLFSSYKDLRTYTAVIEDGLPG